MGDRTGKFLLRWRGSEGWLFDGAREIWEEGVEDFLDVISLTGNPLGHPTNLQKGGLFKKDIVKDAGLLLSRWNRRPSAYPAI